MYTVNNYMFSNHYYQLISISHVVGTKLANLSWGQTHSFNLHPNTHIISYRSSNLHSYPAPRHPREGGQKIRNLLLMLGLDNASHIELSAQHHHCQFHHNLKLDGFGSLCKAFQKLVLLIQSEISAVNEFL